MITEITDLKKSNALLLFDGECRFCVRMARRWTPLLHRRGVALLPLQTPDVRARLGMKPDEPFNEMKLLTADGSVLGGADAVIHLAKEIWWARPFYWLSCFPGIKPLLRKAYVWFAERRYCLGGHCQIKPRKSSHRIVFFEMP